jgi:hypothetical protein
MSNLILTEEELNKIEDKNASFHPFKYHRVMNDIDNVIASHRNLLSANAELSFKNQKYKQALKHICEVEMDNAEFEKEMMFNIARDALKEETK